MSNAQQSLTERLAHRLAAPVDAATRQRARLHLLDWIGCVAGARRDNRRFFDGDIQSAALSGNVLEMDDIHRAALLHPGPVVWPAAIFGGATVGETLDAGVRGYEAMIAVGATFDARHYAHWHNTATAGVFGAAAALGSHVGLSEAQMVWALGHAGSVAGGLWRMRHEPCDTKQAHILIAMQNGLTAVGLAFRGLTGPSFILEGVQGLYAATCDAPRPMILKGPWRIHEVSFKPFAACRHAHPAIDAALHLREAWVPGQPVRVETYRDALTFCDRSAPVSVIEAKFSLQHAVAAALVRGRAGLAEFEPDAIADPALVAARACVTVAERAAITARYPAHFGATVRTGGERVALRDALGDPERPLGPEAIVAKAEALMKWGGVSKRARRKLLDLALDSDESSSADKLFGKSFQALLAA